MIKNMRNETYVSITLFDYSSFVVFLKSGSVSPITSLFFLRIVLTIALEIPYKF